MRQQGRTSPRTPYSTEYRNRKGFSETIQDHAERLKNVELRAGGTPGGDGPRTLEVYKNGFRVGAENILDLIEGANVTLTVTDDGIAIRVEIAATGTGGSGYDTVEDEGAPLTQRDTIDFVGAGVTAADAGGKTVVTIPGGSSTGYDTIEDEGAPLAQETVIDFQGAGVIATAGAGKTIVTIPGDTGGGVVHFDGVVAANYSGSDGDTTTLATGEVVLIYKTVQAAVTGLAVAYGDDLDPPALTLFISAGTYVENVTPPLVSGQAGMALAIYGESMDKVIIAPASGDVFDASNLVGPLYGTPQYSLELHDLTLLASGGGKALINTPSGSSTSEGQVIFCEQVRFVGNVELVVGFNTDAPPTQFAFCIHGGVGAGGTSDLILDGTSIRVLNGTINGALSIGTGGFVAVAATVKDTVVDGDVTIAGELLRLDNVTTLSSLKIGDPTFPCQDVEVRGCQIGGTSSFFGNQINFRAIGNLNNGFFTEDPEIQIARSVFAGNQTGSPVVSGLLQYCYIVGNASNGGLEPGVNAVNGTLNFCAGNIYIGQGEVTGDGALTVTSGVMQQDYGVPTHAVYAAGIFYWDKANYNLYVSVADDGTWQLIGGTQGLQGMPGQDGRDGEDGERGPPGRDGGTGAAGADGRMGPPGWDAEPADDFGLWVPPGVPVSPRFRSMSGATIIAGGLYDTFPRTCGGVNQGVLSSQRVNLVAIDLPIDLVITSISFVSANTAALLPLIQLFGLYNSALGRLAVTNDDGVTAWGSNAKKTLNLTSLFRTTYSGLHYIAILIQATTVPTLHCINTNNGLGAIAPSISINADTGQTSLPVTATNNSGSSLVPYALVS